MFDNEGVATEVLANFITTGFRVAFQMTQPYAKNLGATLWRKVKADIQTDGATFRALTRKGKVAAIVPFAVCVTPIIWYAMMQDVTPNVVQIWGGVVMILIMACAIRCGIDKVRTLVQ